MSKSVPLCTARSHFVCNPNIPSMPLFYPTMHYRGDYYYSFKVCHLFVPAPILSTSAHAVHACTLATCMVTEFQCSLLLPPSHTNLLARTLG